MTRLSQLRASLEAATPGRWFWPHTNTLAAHPSGDPDSEWMVVLGIAGSLPQNEADAAFIAEWRNAAPAILRCLEALKSWAWSSDVSEDTAAVIEAEMIAAFDAFESGATLESGAP